MNYRYYPLTLLLLAGCTAGPDFKSPPSPTVEHYVDVKQTSADFNGQPQLIMKDSIPSQWWKLFE